GEGCSDFNTQLGVMRNCSAVFVSTLNVARKLLGLPLLTYGEGTIASANTLPANTLTGTGAAVGSTADYATSKAAMQMVAQNLYKLKLGLNEVLVALGQDVDAGAAYSSSFPFNVLANVPAAVEDTAGVSSILVTDATAFYASVANAFAT